MKDFVLLDYAVGVLTMASWPHLVLPQFCTTDIKVVVDSEELNENGTSKALVDWKGKCNYQDKAKRVWTKDKTFVEINGTCLIPGDIAPGLAMITSGIVTIFGVEHEIFQGIKARNPDGTVNYTQLDIR